ncbi:MAG: bifunctional folylpolyglutamate synthase/dihydrofolate synthase [Bacteroidia bacterium]|nr:bifunctional folylpolyglutamate synthase/dihydrofolate synthase [Bacteroidia bacterium]
MNSANLNTYRGVIEYLYNRLPVFQRTGAPAYKKGLGNITALCRELDNPQDKIKTIHIAGTNGKGSVSHYLASILQSAGYKRVGLHTSPHLKDFRERIKIDGKPIPEREVILFVNKYKYLIEKVDCSFFELTAAMTFYFFAKRKCEIAVIETGLGGRLDSTNIISPLLSVITNISFDHVAFLGDTLAKIATEKAGIIKPKTSVVIGETHKETNGIFIRKAKECKAHITFADSRYTPVSITNTDKNGRSLLNMDILRNNRLYIKNLQSELTGIYQLKNIPTTLASIEALNSINLPDGKELKKVSKAAIKHGMKNVVKQTGLLGRWQILSRKPLTIADTGHNEAGLREVLSQIKRMKFQQLHFVFGMVNDKDAGGVLALLPKSARYYFCKADIPRALNEALLAEQAAGYGLKGSCYASVKEALKEASKRAKAGDLVFVGGSTFIVAEAL